MRFIYGNMWENIYASDLILVPASRTLDRNDHILTFSPELQKAKEFFPSYASDFGKGLEGVSSFYGLIWSDFNFRDKKVNFGLLQTRSHFRAEPSFLLFKDSLNKLIENSSQFPRICFSYPEDFLSFYEPEKIQSLLNSLPTNVIIWVPYPKKKQKNKEK